MATKKQEREAAEVQEAIAAMEAADRRIAERLHDAITGAAPELAPKLWYKQPAYARDGKVLVFFRAGSVDGERYLSLGFTTEAALDDGPIWPTSYAVIDVTDEVAAEVARLVRLAVGPQESDEP
jgi:uncharacterized protein YdhG (YjbR/CyaY superfamily)